MIKKKVLVIGESCKDIFRYGSCNRLSPEGPVPVFIPNYDTRNIGMAGNVKSNLEALGIKVDIITNEEEIIKERYVEEKRNHLLLRVDVDNKIKRIDVKDINFNVYDAVVISDYDKGFLSEDDIMFIINNHNLVFIDSKKRLDNWCIGASFIKINEKEYNRILNKNLESKISESLIVTLGDKGCRYNGTLYNVAENIINNEVSGAGDTFLAGFVYKYLITRNIEDSLVYANKCASSVLSQKGVSIVDGSNL